MTETGFHLKRHLTSFQIMILGFAGVILLGALGILQPASSAMLHNLSTIGISLKSMTNLLPESKTPQLNA